MGGLLTYDLRNIVKRAPRLTLAINLLAAPVAIGWLWMALALDFPHLLTMTVLIAWLAVSEFFAFLMIEVFHESSCLESCALILFPLFVVFYWFASLVALIRVLSGKAEFPDRAS